PCNFGTNSTEKITMKKWIALILAFALCLSLAACGGSDTSGSSSSGESSSTSESQAEAEASVSADVEEEPADSEAEAESTDAATLTSDVLPEDVVGNTYTYDEVNEAYGFTTTWELTFTGEGEGTMFEPNDLMGDTTYTVSWSYADGLYTVTLVESDNGNMTLSSMFDESYTCDYAVMSDGTFAPANASTGDTASVETTNTGSENADYPAVSYASNSDAQVMDIYLPENATGSDPVIIVVHGGGFKFGDQTMDIIQPVIEAGLANGYVVASVDYRKSDEATFPGALSDVKAAVRYLRANAELYGIDPDQVVIWGESAGAYLSLMTALTPEVESLNGDVTDNLEYSSSVTALVDFYGPVEFYTMDDEYAALGIEGTTYSSDSSFESAFVGQAIGEDEEFTYTTWWYTYVDQLPEDYTLCAWIQVGDSDTSVPYTQSQNFAEKLAEVIGSDNVTFGVIEGAEHEDDLFYTDENLAQVFAFLTDALS
ncbi:MAG: alpha/beta hydrolase, partial [Clostridiales bacterium]|nr:alpha/beta hydrolase [Clostridiales bacterium]